MKKKLLVFVVSYFLFYSGIISQNDHGDCNSAYFLCSKNEILIREGSGPGQNTDELSDASCSIGGLKERNSTWIKFYVSKPGDLSFVINPLVETDDIDFAVFRLDQSLNDCGTRTEQRCMASGTNFENNKCLGKTGLAAGSVDIREKNGCSSRQDNFLAQLNVGLGENYAVYINNYTSSKGFYISFSGNADLGNPDPEIFSCYNYSFEQELALTELSLFPNPTGNMANVSVLSGKEIKAVLFISDIYGKQLQMETIYINKGYNMIPVNLKDVPVGTYTYTVKTEENHLTGKLVKI